MSFGQLMGAGGAHGGEREELISSVADHYTHHACVMTLITPLNCPLPPLTRKPPTSSRLNDKLEDTRVIVPKHPPLQNDPLCSLPSFSFPSPFSAPPSSRSKPMHGRAGYLIITPLPTWLLRPNPLPSFSRLTQRGLCCSELQSHT